MRNYHRIIKNKFIEYKSEANFIPEGVETSSKDIIKHPYLQIYVSDFGKKNAICPVAEVEGKIVGKNMDSYNK